MKRLLRFLLICCVSTAKAQTGTLVDHEVTFSTDLTMISTASRQNISNQKFFLGADGQLDTTYSAFQSANSWSAGQHYTTGRISCVGPALFVPPTSLSAAELANIQQSITSWVDGKPTAPLLPAVTLTGRTVFWANNGQVIPIVNGETLDGLIPVGNSSTLTLSSFSSPILGSNNTTFATTTGLSTGDLAALQKALASDVVFNSLSTGPVVNGALPRSFYLTTGASTLSQQLTLSNIQFINGILTVDSATVTTSEQHNISQVCFNRPDWGPWLKGVAGNSSDGMTSLTLLTNSAALPSNKNGFIGIDNGNGSTFGLYTNSAEGIVGWANNIQGTLTLNATSIFTTAAFTDNAHIRSTGLIVSDQDLATVAMPSNARGYFYTMNSDSNWVVIANDNGGPNAVSGLELRQNGATNRLFTVSSACPSSLLSPGSLVVEGNNPNGILFNTAANAIGGPGSIRFAVGSSEVARLDASGSFLIGTFSVEPSSIFTVRSTKKGVLLTPMSSKDRLAIPDPPAGLEVFDTDLGKKCFYNGHQWEKLLSQPITEDNYLKKII